MPDNEVVAPELKHSRWTQLRKAALLSLAVHLAAGLAMAFVLAHGLETNPDLSSRLSFVANHRSAWIAAWLTWHAAALSILWFFICFEAAHREHESIRCVLRLALILVAAAIVPDLIAESMEIGVLPGLARTALDENVPEAAANARTLFSTLHRVAVMLTGYLANGLYTLGTVVAVCVTRRWYAPWIWSAGLAIGVFGIALSASVLCDSVSGMFWTNVGLVPAIVVWQIGIAKDASRRSTAASQSSL